MPFPGRLPEPGFGFAHPQLVETPPLRLWAYTTRSVPQSHLHRHAVRGCPSVDTFLAIRSTVHLPNLNPVMSP